MFLLLSLLVVNPVMGQERKKLEEKRKQLIKEIQVTSGLLKETKKSREAALHRLTALRRQIKKRQQLITTLERELSMATSSIEQTQVVVESMDSDVRRLKEEYGTILRATFRQRSSKQTLLFLFSSTSINNFFQRVRYIRQYNRYRQKQARLIVETQQMLSGKLDWLEIRRAEKEKLLASTLEQAQLLQQELVDKDVLLITLQQDESRLSKDLATKRASHEKLNRAIEKVIQDEIAKARKNSRSNKSLNNKNNATAKASSGGNFQQQKGKLEWPVTNGVVTSYFGKQEHPTLKGVTITNNGIDIQTDLNASVRSVYNGEVVGTQFVPGYDYMVIIRHDNFYTVYSNLAKINVSRGDQIKTREVIGQVKQDPRTNTAELHFEVWKEKKRLNPIRWMRGK
ncbi:MAG: peptidoglycan DD-metalloendopeptidase family protein [Bacteroidota bacterium]